MSEPVSAFAAYKANGSLNKSKNKNNKRKNNKNNNNKATSTPQKNKNSARGNQKTNAKNQNKNNKNSPKASTSKDAIQITEAIQIKSPLIEPPKANGTAKTSANLPGAKANKINNAQKKSLEAGSKDGKQKTSNESKKLSNGINANSSKESDLDVLTSNDLKLLSLDPSTLSKEDQKRRSVIVAKYSAELEDDDDDEEDETFDENETSDENDSLSEYTLESESDIGSLGEEVPDSLDLGNEVAAIPQPSPGQKRKSVGTASDPTAKKNRLNETPKIVANLKMEPLSPPSVSPTFDSIEDGKKCLQWLINPVKVDDFFQSYWEQGACYIKRSQREYFQRLISFEKIGKMLLENHVEFTKNIDITKYKNGKRETLNPEGRALPSVVWDFYQKGCSVRLLNPQTFIPQIYSICARLQEFFTGLVGVNAYLTPAGTQGFAPHYDDIEAFVVQVEGQKRWRLYKPRKDSEYLPRFSSVNFKQSEIGEPFFEQVLQPGDVLYFPRGVIHQAISEPDHHSLHLTFSAYQKNSFADLMEKMMPLMLEKSISSSLTLRRGLPLNTWRNLGIAFSGTDSQERDELQQLVGKMMKSMITSLPLDQIIDQAVDQLAKKFQHEALPPEIQNHEKSRTVFGSKNSKDDSGAWVCDYDINLKTNVRLLRANILRLVEEEDKMRIYYYLDNSKEYCEYEPNFIEIARKEAGCVEVLIRSYPAYVGVAQLPLKSAERKIAVVSALWERGLLMMEKPFIKN